MHPLIPGDRSLGGKAIGFALAAAVLFGLSTPGAKALLVVADPWLLAGVLYLGSGIGLLGFRTLLRVLGRVPREAPLRRRDLPWLIAAIITGGGIGPVFLMFGLAGGSATQASLLLNLEGVFTALLAWFVFGEHFDRRIALGMVSIAAGALLIAWQPGHGLPLERGALLLAGACLAWAVDNNLTRNISGGDPALIAGLKGSAAGVANLTVALSLGAPLPPVTQALAAGVVGFFGYGVSLMLFVRALRELGAARTGAYFSTAPFVGALVSVVALGEPLSSRLVAGGVLMALGVWLHISERHVHEHAHEALQHEHLHRHDAHHQHDHEPGTPVGEPHSHPHLHAPLRHSHRHYPDLHHRHPH